MRFLTITHSYKALLHSISSFPTYPQITPYLTYPSYVHEQTAGSNWGARIVCAYNLGHDFVSKLFPS